MEFSIIIPVCNEDQIIGQTIQELERVINENDEVIIVNDHSVDNTIKIAENLIRDYNNIRLVHNLNKSGFASTLKQGFCTASGDIFVVVMADLCDDLLDIKKMYNKILEGYDIVCGSRYMKDGKRIGGSVLKSLFSRFVGKSLKILIDIPTYDVSNAFKMYKRKVIEDIQIESRGTEASMEIVLKAYFKGYKLAEVPTIWKERFCRKPFLYIFKSGFYYLRWYLWAIYMKIKDIFRLIMH